LGPEYWCSGRSTSREQWCRFGAVVDRFTGTAVLTTGRAAEIGTLGYVARASGLTHDARIAHPSADCYTGLSIPVRHRGDVLARFQVRVEDLDASMNLLRRLLGQVSPDGGHAHPDARAGRRDGVGIVEGWRGAIVRRVELRVAGVLTRVNVVDPSFLNWPAVPVAVADTIVPDFPLTNKSCNLSYAGKDL
jgi:Ni,Fe-hydrogenase III large subunit